MAKLFKHIQGNVFELYKGYVATPEVRKRIDAIVKLRDETGMSFTTIGAQFGITGKRAAQIYSAENIKRQKNPMDMLKSSSQTVKNFLSQIAAKNKLSQTWEDEPSIFLIILQIVRKLTKKELENQVGKENVKEILNFLSQFNIQLS